MEKTRERNSQKTRLAVLEAAEHLFSENGFAGTSMRDLAQASGVSQPLIHHHFGRKEALYTAVKKRVIERFQSLLPSGGRDSEGSDAGTEFEHILRMLFRFCRENPRTLRLMTWARLEGDTGGWPGEEELVERFRELGARYQKSGQIRTDIDFVMVVAIVENLITSWWENRNWMQKLYPQQDSDAVDSAFLDHISKILTRGVGVEPAPRLATPGALK